MVHHLLDVRRDEAGVTCMTLLYLDGRVEQSILEPGLVDHAVMTLCGLAHSVMCTDTRPFSVRDKKIVDIRSYLPRHVLDPKEVEGLLRIHRGAYRSARVDLRKHSLFSMVPPSSLHRAGSEFLHRMAGNLRLVPDVPEDRQDFLDALRDMERRGIGVDLARAREGIGGEHGDFCRGILSSARDGRVYTQFDPFIGRTGRIKTAGGFSCMNIPHGFPRSLIVPSPGNVLVTVDYNAIDYRCLVSACEDPKFTGLYRGYPDFHRRTASLMMGRGYDDVSPEHRKIVKEMTYVCVYGGSLETISRKLGVDPAVARKLVTKMERILEPVIRLRQQLYEGYTVSGNVVQPSGRKLGIEPGAHPGKVLGIFAQGYSSWIFERALVTVTETLRGTRTFPVFPVHDELNIECPEDEVDQHAALVGWSMEEPATFPSANLKVKIRKGKTYAETTDS